MSLFRFGGPLGLMMVALLVAACSVNQPDQKKIPAAVLDYDILLSVPDRDIGFREAVQPVLDRRCVVCHGCFDAPCQLKLSSFAGLDRGASKEKVYDGARITASAPTRLFIDAHSTEEWRGKGFFSVIADITPDSKPVPKPASKPMAKTTAGDQPTDIVAGNGNDASSPDLAPEHRLKQSVMYRMLRLKQRHPQPRIGKLPKSMTIGLDRKESCAKLDEVGRYEVDHPNWGMPYAMPNLADSEYKILVQWLAQGAKGPAPAEPSPVSGEQIVRWEAFLNGPSLKQRLVSRYLYEHWFQGHLRFDGAPGREFFRLVRSSTPSGQPIDEIATERPYDAPIPLPAKADDTKGGKAGKQQDWGPFYYRLRLIDASIVAKDHVEYKLSDRKLERVRELFITPDYAVTELPSYDPLVASNPFKAYAALPVESRYRFLLDDALFFIEGFIKGPVCRGQIALNVIEDQFWVAFLDPSADQAVQDPAFLIRMADNLQLPSAEGDHLRVFSVENNYRKREARYMAAKVDYFKKLGSIDLDQAMGLIWDGGGSNHNAALTVFRHLDSASVTYGLVGDFPETAWLIDYPLFERIHYLLVAGFNVFGNLGHQLNTRLYMDFLRIEGEDHFLALLPVDKRRTIRDGWYQGIREGLDEEMGEREWLDVASVVGYQTDDPQRELYHAVMARLGPLATGSRYSETCTGKACRTGPSQERLRAEQAMQSIAGMKGEHLQVFPDISFVRVRVPGEQGDLAFTLIRNKAYKSVSSLLADEIQRDASDLANDTLTVVPWLEGAYPNFFFVVDLDEVEAFAEVYRAITDHKDYERFVGLYGIRRTNDRFWQEADWFHDQYAREKPLASGLFDFNRYQNR